MPCTSRRNVWRLDLHDSLDRLKAGSTAKISNTDSIRDDVRGTEGSQSVRELVLIKELTLYYQESPVESLKDLKQKTDMTTHVI